MRKLYICPTAQNVVVRLEGPLATSSLRVTKAQVDEIEHENEQLTQKMGSSIWDV